MSKDIEHTIIGERSKIYKEVSKHSARGSYSNAEVLEQALYKTGRNYREQLVREGKKPTDREVKKFVREVAENRDRKKRI